MRGLSKRTSKVRYIVCPHRFQYNNKNNKKKKSEAYFAFAATRHLQVTERRSLLARPSPGGGLALRVN